MSENELAKQELMEKHVAFYQTFLSAWTASRMEKDKQVLTLSALAIGLLTTFRSELDDVFGSVSGYPPVRLLSFQSLSSC